MIRNVPTFPTAPTRSLVRADQLHAALDVLGAARDLAARAARRSVDHPRSSDLLERLDAHREILARRAANVALTACCPAEELHELRDATRLLVAVHGRTARHFGLVGHLS